MNRRVMFLEALGITTEWLPRGLNDAQADSHADAASDPAQGVAPQAGTTSATPARDLAAPAMVEQSVPAQPATAHAAGDVRTNPVVDAMVDADAAAAAAHVADVARMAEAFDAPPPLDPARPVAPAPRQSSPAQQSREAAIAQMPWKELAQSVSGCTACGLCETRTNTVFGVGDMNAEWMLVGEAPGENEDLQGEPFVGQAGKLLDNMLASLGMARGRNVYIANVLKCRPPGNRNPEPDEVAQCEPYLKRQIVLIKPKVIVVLGRFAAQSLLRSTTPIGKLRGAVHQYEGIPVVVTYHPAYLLRTTTDKARAWEDLCLAREVHERAGAQA